MMKFILGTAINASLVCFSAKDTKRYENNQIKVKVNISIRKCIHILWSKRQQSDGRGNHVMLSRTTAKPLGLYVRIRFHIKQLARITRWKDGNRCRGPNRCWWFCFESIDLYLYSHLLLMINRWWQIILDELMIILFYHLRSKSKPQRILSKRFWIGVRWSFPHFSSIDDCLRWLLVMFYQKCFD